MAFVHTSNWEERILRIFRHGTRDFVNYGSEHTSADGSFTTWAGAGVSPDGEAHISPKSMMEIRARAQELDLPEGFDTQTDIVFYTSSDKVRCIETIRNVNIGINNRQLLAGGVPEHKINGVHAMAPAVKAAAAPYRLRFKGDKEGHAALGEPELLATDRFGDFWKDEGNQLYVESMMPENKERFPLGSFRYQATVAMDPEDARIQETPTQVAYRGLAYLVPKLAEGRNRLVHGATHTFGIEALFNEVRRVSTGINGNELYANAQGGFDEGGFFEVRVQVNARGNFADTMQVSRTQNADLKKELGDAYNGTELLKPEELPTATLLRYMRK